MLDCFSFDFNCSPIDLNLMLLITAITNKLIFFHICRPLIEKQFLKGILLWLLRYYFELQIKPRNLSITKTPPDPLIIWILLIIFYMSVKELRYMIVC